MKFNSRNVGVEALRFFERKKIIYFEGYFLNVIGLAKADSRITYIP